MTAAEERALLREGVRRMLPLASRSDPAHPTLHWKCLLCRASTPDPDGMEGPRIIAHAKGCIVPRLKAQLGEES